MKRSKKRIKKGHKKPIHCPYCGGQALLKDAKSLFNDPYIKKLFVCVRYPECDSYVSAHENTLEPMGSLANAILRKKRMMAHYHFDQLWKSGIFTRDEAYRWLCYRFGGNARRISTHLHIGAMGETMCDKVVKEAKRALWARKKTQEENGGA
ncbi:MAG: DUF3268 family zinc-finger domain-containing protein [Defluviitaleaceae bacterium]|nr:DUF3268 family zinc-finger domain-containing protein [Defluviitaleaceae bacterium]